jgi:hypothetical protein
VKPWVFRRGPREEGRPKALALKAFSAFVFLGLVFLGYRLSTLVKERHELSFVKPWVIPPWPKGKEHFQPLSLWDLIFFLGYRLSTLVEERHELSFVKPWPKGRGPAKSPGSKSISNFCLSGTCVFWDIVYQRW